MGVAEQPFLHKIENIEDAPGPAIAIVKGMDGLEPVVDDRHFDQRIEIAEASGR